MRVRARQTKHLQQNPSSGTQPGRSTNKGDSSCVLCCPDPRSANIKAARGRSLQNSPRSTLTPLQPHATMCHTSCSTGCQPAGCVPSSCQTSCYVLSPCQTSCCMSSPCQTSCCVPSPCQTSCCVPSSCQPASCTPSSCQTSCCVPVSCRPALSVSCKPAVYVVPSCQSSVCVPVSCKPLVLMASSCQSSGGCQPSRPTLLYRPVSCSTPSCF
ncbi:keratin-associated protein 12-1-like [Mustela nigripes]|uniref:keratin-associated protein 12-1-like n=1 Tax=Mustela nigripes TaxID=77151 RepID=UPI002815070C|nr:keratin-associated protein 12-1-like [Mustela nigripes]